MELGNFSVSLAVGDLSRSLAFYEKLGFEVFGGDQSQGWLIVKSGGCVIGLFQGLFERNILTFNPGLGCRRPGAGELHRHQGHSEATQVQGRHLRERSG